MVGASKSENLSGPIRLGMVGGGQGAFIGGVHRIAARLDGDFQLVAGALSSDPARAKASAAELGLDPSRSYGSFQEMAKAEAEIALREEKMADPALFSKDPATFNRLAAETEKLRAGLARMEEELLELEMLREELEG